MTVGERIKQAREAKKMSQDELAKRMGYKDRSSISKIEKGKDDNIYLDTILKIADVLDCSPLFLMGWQTSDDKEREEHFIRTFNRLTDYQKEVVEKLLESLTNDK